MPAPAAAAPATLRGRRPTGRAPPRRRGRPGGSGGNSLSGKRAALSRERSEPGAQERHREVLDHRCPSERPRQEHSETSTVGELKAPRDCRRRPSRVDEVHSERSERRGEEPCPGEEPGGERELRGGNEKRDREQGRVREHLVRADHPGKAPDVEELPRRRDREGRSDEEPEGSSHFWFSVQSYGMKSTLY